jgi:hypothetical protein
MTDQSGDLAPTATPAPQSSPQPQHRFEARAGLNKNDHTRRRHDNVVFRRHEMPTPRAGLTGPTSTQARGNTSHR